MMLTAFFRVVVMALLTVTLASPWASAQDESASAYLLDNATPLTSIAGPRANQDDLNPLKSIIGDAVVIELFEHGSAGDGATYDIGFQWLSGALERGHKFVYICLNNEGYMNTGIQRSSATLLGAWTTTTPSGDARPGKPEWHKDMTKIIAAHNIPYVAQAAAHNWKDLMTKVRKAEQADGPAFINVLTPCDRGWRFEPEKTMEVSQLMVEAGLWPLYEVVDGKYKMTGARQKKRPVMDALLSQKRFSHITKNADDATIAAIQAKVDEEWDALQALCEMSAAE